MSVCLCVVDSDEELPEIKHGEAITDRRSTFQAHLALVLTPKQVQNIHIYIHIYIHLNANDIFRS